MDKPLEENKFKGFDPIKFRPSKHSSKVFTVKSVNKTFLEDLQSYKDPSLDETEEETKERLKAFYAILDKEYSEWKYQSHGSHWYHISQPKLFYTILHFKAIHPDKEDSLKELEKKILEERALEQKPDKFEIQEIEKVKMMGKEIAKNYRQKLEDQAKKKQINLKLAKLSKKVKLMDTKINKILEIILIDKKMEEKPSPNKSPPKINTEGKASEESIPDSEIESRKTAAGAAAKNVTSTAVTADTTATDDEAVADDTSLADDLIKVINFAEQCNAVQWDEDIVQCNAVQTRHRKKSEDKSPKENSGYVRAVQTKHRKKSKDKALTENLEDTKTIEESNDLSQQSEEDPRSLWIHGPESTLSTLFNWPADDILDKDLTTAKRYLNRAAAKAEKTGPIKKDPSAAKNEKEEETAGDTDKEGEQTSEGEY